MEYAVPAHMPPPHGGDALTHRMEAALIERIGTTRFDLWLRDTTRFHLVDGDLVITVGTRSFHDWLDQAYGEAIRAAAAAVFQAPISVRYVVDASFFAEVDSKSSRPIVVTVGNPAKVNLFGEPDPPPSPKEAKIKHSEISSARATKPTRRWKSLKDFFVGASNRVAHASALSVVEEPGLGVNPLVLHGPVGTGKTHLLEGIYAGLRRRWPDGRPCYVTGEEFISRFVQSARFGKQNAFRRQFRECSALLIDDLHVLATAPASQKEFLYTFDSLLSDGRQIVVTADCHPRLAEELMPELIDRLLGGAVWGVLPPDDETRLGILRNKSASTGAYFPEETLRYLAQHLRGNVRELEGAIHGIRHFARVTNQPINTQLVNDAIGDLLRHTIRNITVTTIDTTICSLLGMKSGSLQSKARAWAVSHPRMIAIYLARKHTMNTYGEIAHYFGAKTHSSAVAAEKRVRAWIASDDQISLGDRDWHARDLIDRIERELQK